MSKKPDSFLGWLGRQVGFVSKAIKTDVTPPPVSSQPQQESAPPPNVVFRADKVEEAQHPADPKLTLRRTTIDEVINRPNDTPEEQK
jgi:hypothetical protein